MAIGGFRGESVEMGDPPMVMPLALSRSEMLGGGAVVVEELRDEEFSVRVSGSLRSAMPIILWLFSAGAETCGGLTFGGWTAGFPLLCDWNLPGGERFDLIVVDN